MFIRSCFALGFCTLACNVPTQTEMHQRTLAPLASERLRCPEESLAIRVLSHRPHARVADLTNYSVEGCGRSSLYTCGTESFSDGAEVPSCELVDDTRTTHVDVGPFRMR